MAAEFALLIRGYELSFAHFENTTSRSKTVWRSSLGNWSEKMVRKTKRIETTFELHETVVVTGSRIGLMLSPEDAAALVAIPARVTYRWFERGSIHSLETGDGSLLVPDKCAACRRLVQMILSQRLRPDRPLAEPEPGWIPFAH